MTPPAAALAPLPRTQAPGLRHQPNPLRQRLTELAESWHRNGLPSRSELEKTAGALSAWKRAAGVEGLWNRPPAMMTATLDDGMGYGLDIIHRYARVAGIDPIPLGLMQPVEVICQACRRRCPDLLGLTVLQLDTGADLARVRSGVPAATRIIAGGPVFRADPEMARNIDVVAKDAGDFLDFLLSLPDAGPAP